VDGAHRERIRPPIAPPTHGATGITWYENGVQFNVIGPPDAFTGEEALAVANSL
jgi:hypothetical protein